MNDDFLNKAMHDCAIEVDYLANLRKDLSDTEFNNLLTSTLGKYIKNEEIVFKLISCGTHTWEISIILEMSNESWFSETLLFLTESFRNLMRINKKLAVSIIERSYPKIHESLNSWHDAYFLNNVDRKNNQRHFVRACFRHLGDTVESVHYPHIECIHELLSNINVLGIPPKNKRGDFGSIISALIQLDKLKFIYRDNLHDIPLNQWRNIAQHSSYAINKESGLIVCVYGNGRHKIEITSDEIYNLLCRLNDLHSLQKIALDLFLCEFMDDINFNSNDTIISLETIFGGILNNINVYGFHLKSMKNTSGFYQFELVDINESGVKGLNKLLWMIKEQVLLLKEKGIESTFNLYTKKGDKITSVTIELVNSRM